MRRIIGVAVAVGLALAACGGGSATSTTAATGNTADDGTTATGASDQEAVTVNVVADEYSFESDLTTFEVGVPYHFVVENVGGKEHEFMIVVPIEPGMMDMEAMDEMAMAVIEEDDLDVGDTGTVDYTFTEDDIGDGLEFACHLEGHYEDGMRLPITVTG